MSAALALRERTAAAHEAVDAAFAGYDLADAGAYRAFLIAHARALPAVEAWLGQRRGLPDWRPRAGALAEDLATLGVAMPAPLLFALPDDEAAAWGALYVTEGSRLGGVMLARSVGEGLPTAYLSAGFEPGEWRALRAALDAALVDGAALDRAVIAAEETFGLYRQALL
ncbi:biliverdin-producing heme oxygenase [Sphingomonas sp.]|uniref:biliverdin-producing heme oxygenase n=1 Tax=Sphingomonas sp. TaxID=28214 RepID=UPI0035B183C6